MTFPENFLWGASTSSYQIEGAVKQDGRGVSIWDTFCEKPGAIDNNDVGDVACDHYNRYREDIAIMSEIGLNAYRFSFSWSRLFPEANGRAEKRGFDFYDRLVDELLEQGIEPVATLYHWDLPQYLQDRGGWSSRNIIEPFAEYAASVANHFGDRIKRISPINEPWVVSWLGYGSGVLAPGIKDYSEAIAAAHHTIVAHNAAFKAIKSVAPHVLVGPVLNQLTPDLDDYSDPFQIQAAKTFDQFLNYFWMDGTFRGKYSDHVWSMYGKALEDVVKEGDLDVVANDWLGINYYFNNRIGHSVPSNHPTANGFIGKLAGLYSEGAPVGPTTDTDWPITPYGIGDLLVRWTREYGDLIPQMFITENGCAYADVPDENGVVNDVRRQSYLRDHILALDSAVSRGANLGGYFHWSLLDNFEWARGFSMRFGLVHVDYQTQKRTLKQSAFLYRDIIKSQGQNLFHS